MFVPKAEMFIFYYRSRKSSKTGTEPNSDSLNSEGQSHTLLLYISSALPVFLTPKYDKILLIQAAMAWKSQN